MQAGPGTPQGLPRFGLLLCLVALVALAIREHFVLVTVVDIPIRGDIREYVAYAWNLVEHGIFSSAFPQPGIPAPDSFRSPGYPWLLAIGMSASPQLGPWSQLGGWYDFVLQAQVLLGTATVVLATLLARHWLPAAWSLLAGFLLAIWPHHVAASGALMPEVLFGFGLVAALYCFGQAWRSRRTAWFVATGVAFGLAYLVNPLVALFPPCLAAMTWLKRERIGAALIFGMFMVPVAGLALRNAPLPSTTTASSSGRAAINLVQGAWPQYHDAHRSFRTGHPVAVAIMDEIASETVLLQDRPLDGLARIFGRLGNDPKGYAWWYLARKPWLLWDWNVQIGAGGFYVLEVARSPFETSRILRAVAAGMRSANPVFSALLLAGMLGMLLGWRRDAWVPAAATGALAAYFTLMHMLLQAEPRYAIAYRGIEAVVVATALAALAHAAFRVASGRAASARPGRQPDAPRQF